MLKAAINALILPQWPNDLFGISKDLSLQKEWA